MPGFIALISQNKRHSNIGIFDKLGIPKRNMENDFLTVQDLVVERLTVNKYLADKVFFSDDEYCILIEGVILNSAKLVSKYKTDTFKDCIIEMYKNNRETFFSEFRGSFCGIFYDIKAERNVIFTDHIGSRQIFHANLPDGQNLVTSDMYYMAEYIKHYDIPRSLDLSGAYYLLTLGYMLEDTTLFNEVKRLMPGHYIKISHNSFEIKCYYKLKFTYDCDLPKKKIIEKLDELFTDAVRSAFEKDKEYGYKHLVNLTAGYDSRMTTVVAHELGYGQSIVNNTVSQTGYNEELIPRKIASDLKHQWIFKSLDNGVFLMDIEPSIKVACGMFAYFGFSHVVDFFDTINMDNYGLSHTGHFGDKTVGSIMGRGSNDWLEYYDKSLAYSKFIDLKTKVGLEYKLSYDNAEDFRFFNRVLSGDIQCLTAEQRYTESVSPFGNVEFMEFCFSIDPTLRIGHNLYYEWIKTRHPLVAKYYCSRVRGKLSSKTITIKGRTAIVAKLPYIIIRHIIGKFIKIDNKDTIPYDLWYNNNPDLRDAMDKYYESSVFLLTQFPELKKDCETQYNKGSTVDKMNVLTLIGMKKMYF